MRLIGISFLTIIILFTSCQSKEKNVLFKKLSAEQTGIDFKNQLQYTDSLTVLEFEYMFNGAGVAVCDINNDGLQDLLFTGNMVSSRLYLNITRPDSSGGNLKFEDITAKAGLNTEGWCYGASIVDINQDGFQDIYISKAGNRKTKPDAMKNLFFINNGNNTFTEKAAEMGLDENGYDIQAAFLDYDKDGDLDMYLLKNAFVNYNRNNVRAKLTEGQAASTDKLFRNDSLPTPKGGANPAPTPPLGVGGLPHFKDVSSEAGILSEGYSLGAAISDFNQDGFPDIFVSNDFLSNDILYINNGNGTFTDRINEYLKHTSFASMGNDAADINNDGLTDLFVLDMLPEDNFRRKMIIPPTSYDKFQLLLAQGYTPSYTRNTLQLNNGTPPPPKGEQRVHATLPLWGLGGLVKSVFYRV